MTTTTTTTTTMTTTLNDTIEQVAKPKNHLPCIFAVDKPWMFATDLNIECKLHEFEYFRFTATHRMPSQSNVISKLFKILDIYRPTNATFTFPLPFPFRSFGKSRWPEGVVAMVRLAKRLRTEFNGNIITVICSTTHRIKMICLLDVGPLSSYENNSFWLMNSVIGLLASTSNRWEIINSKWIFSMWITEHVVAIDLDRERWPGKFAVLPMGIISVDSASRLVQHLRERLSTESNSHHSNAGPHKGHPIEINILGVSISMAILPRGMQMNGVLFEISTFSYLLGMQHVDIDIDNLAMSHLKLMNRVRFVLISFLSFRSFVDLRRPAIEQNSHTNPN